MLKMVDGTGIIGVDMVCPLGGAVSPPQPPNYDRVELEGAGMVVLPNSLDAPLERLELGGKTEQVTTTGKNLLNSNIYVQGYLASIDTGQKISLNTEVKSFTTTMDINALQGKSISISIRTKGNSGKKYAFTDEKDVIINGKFDAGMADYSEYNNIQVPQNAKKFYFSVTYEVQENTKLQLEYGNKATSYEPYTGGKPSPRPEYPQEIKNSGKWNEGTQKHEVSVKISNKNLFDLKKIKNGFVTSTGNGFNIMESSVYPKSIYLDMAIPLKVGQTLNISGVEPDVCRIRVKHDTGNYYLKYTANKDTEIIICFYGGLTEENKRTILIEISDTSTNYEPYAEQTLTLTSDRPITKWDKLVEQDGQIGWLYKSKIIDGFDGQSSNITLGGKQGEVQHFSVVFTDVPNGNGNGDIYVDRYRAIAMSYTKAEFGICCNWNSGVKFFSAPNENVTTVQEFKTWLAENPLVLAYETTSTEFVPLPQSEQNAIRALKTYYPTTVITADGGELDPDIKITYRKEI